jgi:hypothetical protein
MLKAQRGKKVGWEFSYEIIQFIFPNLNLNFADSAINIFQSNLYFKNSQSQILFLVVLQIELKTFG